MVAFGGSGPVHALAIARKLRITRVIFPIGAGVMSALGLLVSPLGFEISRSRRVYLADLDAASFEGCIAPLVEEASGFLHRAGIADPHISTRLDMRHQGQGYAIERSGRVSSWSSWTSTHWTTLRRSRPPSVARASGPPATESRPSPTACDRTTGVRPRRAARDQAVIVLVTKFNCHSENKLSLL